MPPCLSRLVERDCGGTEVKVHRTVEDIAEAGRRSLSPDLAGHIGAGAGDGSTVEANAAAVGRCRLVPRVATGVGTPTTRSHVLGFDLDLPVLTAPMGPLELIDPLGARAVAEGAGRAGAGTVIALTSAPVLEDAIVPTGVALFQLYWWGDRDWILGMVHRARDAGYAAVVVTVDVPDYGTRWADVRSGFDHHRQMGLPNLVAAPKTRQERLAFQQALTFDDLAWLADVSPLPIVVKGVLSGADAALAVSAGVGGVYVSNHGGRALGGMVATLSALGEVADVVGGALPVFVDGGFRTAEDVAKGLAAGADVVVLGRPIAWALAADGADGVAMYLSLIQEDLQKALTVLGAVSPAELGRSHIRWV